MLAGSYIFSLTMYGPGHTKYHRTTQIKKIDLLSYFIKYFLFGILQRSRINTPIRNHPKVKTLKMAQLFDGQHIGQKDAQSDSNDQIHKYSNQQYPVHNVKGLLTNFMCPLDERPI